MEPFDPSYVAGGPALGTSDPRPYDFARQPAFQPTELRRAEAAHLALASVLADALTARLGEPARVTVGGAVEVLAVDFERSRARPAALFAAGIGTGGLRLALDVAPALALFWVERHLGGVDPLGTEARALSALERSVVEGQWLPAVFAAFAQAWGSVPPRADGFASAPETLVLAAPEAPLVVLDLAVAVGGGSAPVSLAYPADTLRALLDVPARPSAPPTSVSSPAFDALPLALRAELGRTRLTVGELLRLAPGDVIPLGARAGSAVPVRVGDGLAFEARAGTRGARLALQLLTRPAPPSHD